VRRGCSRDSSAGEAFPQRRRSVARYFHLDHLVVDEIRLDLLDHHRGKPFAWVAVGHLVFVAAAAAAKVVAARLSQQLLPSYALMWARQVATNDLLYRGLQMPFLFFVVSVFNCLRILSLVTKRTRAGMLRKEL